MRSRAHKLLMSLFFVFLSFICYYCYYHILMLSFVCVLFVIIVSQPGTTHSRVRCLFVLLRYVHEKQFENNLRLKQLAISLIRTS